MVCAIRGGEFRDTETSMLINPLIFHVNVGRIDLKAEAGPDFFTPPTAV